MAVFQRLQISSAFMFSPSRREEEPLLFKIFEAGFVKLPKIFFRGDFPVEDWNSEFWKLKEEIVGVKAPVERTTEDLDPPTIYHVCQDFDMIRYQEMACTCF